MNNPTTPSTGRRLGARLGLALGAAAFALTSGVALAAPASASTGLEAIEESLVHVYIEYSGYVGIPDDGAVVWSDRITAAFMCTGWFVSDQGHIATAGHCVDPDDGREVLITKFLTEHDAEELYSDAMTSWPVEGYDPGSDIDHTIEVVQTNGASAPIIDDWTVAELVDYQQFESGDAALLKVAGVTGTVPLTIAQRSPDVGEQIVSIGFPGTVQNVVDVRRLAASFKTGTVSSHQVTSRGVPVIEINAQVSQGMSGGPTIDASGDVVGINSFGINGESQSFNFVTDTEGLASFLTRNGVAITQSGPATDADAGSETTQQGEIVTAASTPSSGDGLGGAIVLTGGLVAAGAVAVTFIVALMRRRGSNPSPQASPQASFYTGHAASHGAFPQTVPTGFAPNPGTTPAPVYAQAPPPLPGTIG